MKKEYLREFDAFGKCRQGLEQNRRYLVPKIWKIDTYSEFLTTNTNLFLWKSF